MGSPPSSIDAVVLRDVLDRFTAALEAHREELDSLNVYPVPDGDTGTNMLLTQLAVRDELARLEGAEMAELTSAVARASLMAARGNSGVILAQALRGFCEPLAGAETDPEGLAQALLGAAREARRAVAKPAEGTILSVLADAARAAGEAAGSGSDRAGVAEAAFAAALESLERTRDELPELRAAGVVDAGGRGIVLLLDALAAVLGGHDMTVPVGPPGPVGHMETEEARAEGPKFEVMYLVQTEDDRIPGLTAALAPLGDSLVVVGGGGLFKAHIHTDDAGSVIEAALGFGRLRDIEIVDLAAQVARHCVAGQARAVRVAEEQATALVAVADGDGLARIFGSLGAVVVRGGPGNNPSVGDLVEAIEAAPAPSVLVLPNHRNVGPAAERAVGSATRKRAAVIPAPSVPQGLAAAAAFNPMASLGENEEAMGRAAGACAAGALTRAVRDAQTPAGPVRAGEWLGLAGNEVVTHGDDPAAVAAHVAGALRSDLHELVTLILGADAQDGEAKLVQQSLTDALPGFELEVHDGGQPGYPYLLGLE